MKSASIFKICKMCRWKQIKTIKYFANYNFFTLKHDNVSWLDFRFKLFDNVTLNPKPDQKQFDLYYLTDVFVT